MANFPPPCLEPQLLAPAALRLLTRTWKAADARNGGSPNPPAEPSLASPRRPSQHYGPYLDRPARPAPAHACRQVWSCTPAATRPPARPSPSPRPPRPARPSPLPQSPIPSPPLPAPPMRSPYALNQSGPSKPQAELVDAMPMGLERRLPSRRRPATHQMQGWLSRRGA